MSFSMRLPFSLAPSRAGVDEHVVQVAAAVHLHFGEGFAHGLFEAAEGGRKVAGEVEAKKEALSHEIQHKQRADDGGKA
uniref:Uncharacterized protein n=1 Tax=Tanacetum cinerariifolium TaxID=118510 RepID=A0A699SCP1_TANCI|nr:hypothetical protein [Tanacetum cinerariifolium]